MKRLALTLLLGLSAFAVQAQSPMPAEAAAPAAAAQEANPAAADETVLITSADTGKTVMDTGCIRQTGTLTKRRDKKGCTGAPGQSYSRADIERTGAIDTADAIQKLSPAATVRRH